MIVMTFAENASNELMITAMEMTGCGSQKMPHSDLL